MKKKLDINGEVVRKERVKRAWTQEELSERSSLAVRTLRRLEAGQGSLDSLRRVAEALDMEPAKALLSEPSQAQEWLPFDMVRMEMSSQLFESCAETFIDNLVRRIKAVRRHLASERGILLPGVRLNDFISSEMTYRILLREVVVGRGALAPGKLLAVAPAETLEKLGGPLTEDPTYGMPALWIPESQRQQAEALACMIFTSVDVLATHLTKAIKDHAARLLGIEETARLLEHLHQPRLVAEVVPARVSLTTLRTILGNLLSEHVSLLDLGLILETLADHASLESCPDELTEIVRRALRDTLSKAYADSEGKIVAYTLEAEWEQRAQLDATLLDGLHDSVKHDPDAVIVTAAGLRRAMRARFPQVVVLSREEIATRYRVESRGHLNST